MDCWLVSFVLLVSLRVTVGVGGDRSLNEWEGCGECHPDECVTELRCPVGLVKDPCGCCWECGGEEGQPCDLDPSRSFYGHCGDGLLCQILDQDLLAGEVPEPQCVCAQQGAICGSDDHTYENPCQLRAAQYRQREEGKLTVTAAHHGPCKAKPIIAMPPRDIISVEGNDIIFSCEVSAYPMAMIEWRKEGNSIFLPADDSHMAVQARGGPRRFELTGWLQIENVRLADEGVYTCAARNGFGEVLASARLQVVEKDSELAHRMKQQNKEVYHEYEEDDNEEDYKGACPLLLASPSGLQRFETGKMALRLAGNMMFKGQMGSEVTSQ
ncbi:hypothetical protein JZ751_012599, partial [Albula glossodonta]